MVASFMRMLYKEHNSVMTDLIGSLESEWSKEEGFLGFLREGEFSEEAFLRLLGLLNRIDFTDGQTVIDLRLVSLVWCVPKIVDWRR